MENNIRRGYPNPDYTEKDIREGQLLEMNAEILIDDKEYRELCYKAAAFDILTSAVKATGKVDDNVVRAVTGTLKETENEEIAQFRRWWQEESAVNQRLREQIASLENARKELTEILKQNKIGPFAEDQEGAEVSDDGEN